MKIAFIGDIVGRPAREMIGSHLRRLRQEHSIDYVIANYENASHGFGLTEKNCKELLGYGIDMMSGGNHSFDKKEILEMFDRYPLIRPINYPKSTAGDGVFETTILTKEIAIVNLMGNYTMPMADNPFTKIVEVVDTLIDRGISHIIIDIHAESSAEKRALLYMLKDRVSAIIGTHTHIGTDDLQVLDGCCYVTDVGLTGCRDNVIGMSSDVPIHRFLTGLGGHFDVPDKCKRILQMILFELDESGRCVDAKKIKLYDNKRKDITEAVVEKSDE
jgi:metallophosphoesterase (TIGR00282 family)